MTVSKTGLLVEAIARKRAKQDVKPVVLDTNFPKQNAFIMDSARYIAAQCSRRAGKTNGLAYRFHRAMEMHPKSQSVYMGLTLDSAKSAMWPAFLEFNDRHNLGYTFVESKGTIHHPNGAKLRILGADMKNFIKRLRGSKYPAVAIDEAQDFGVHLQALINDVLVPAMIDYEDSWLAITGTPGAVPQGYFYEATHENAFGFSVHKWTIVDNPNVTDPQGFIDDFARRNKWASDNATLRREWKNEWVLDKEALWIKYNENLNHFDSLPATHVWNYILGVDIGFRDADAIAVVAWSETCKETYLVEEIIRTKQGISDLAEMIEAAQKKYKAYKIVMDEGGLGKKIGEDFRSRFGCPIEPADKVRKQDNVELLNDSMRLGEFKAKRDSRFALESYMVQIDWERSTPKRVQLKKNYHSDIIDAVLYAFRDTYAYTHRPPPPPGPKWGTKEWAEQQHDKMFESELEGLKNEQEYLKINGFED